MYLNLPQDIEKIFHQSKTLEEMGKGRYLSYMVSVHFLVTYFEVEISNRNLLECQSLIHQQDRFVYFRIPFGKGYRDLPFDFELAAELPNSPARQVYDRLKADIYLLNPAQQSSFLELEQAIFYTKTPYSGDLNLFEEVRRVVAQVRKSSKQLTAYQGDLEQLQALSHSLSLPLRKQFALELLKAILENQDHPAYANVRQQLENSYFKGSVDAFRQNLDGLFQSLNKVEESISRIANMLMAKSAGRFRNLSATALCFGSQQTEAPRDQAQEQALQRYWSSLRRLPFGRIRELYSCKKYQQRVAALLDTRQNNPRERLSEAADLMLEMTQKMGEVGDIMSSLNISLQNEVKLGLRAQEDKRQEESWLKENSRHLFIEILRLLDHLKSLNFQTDDQPVPNLGQAETLINALNTALILKKRKRPEASAQTKTRLLVDPILAALAAYAELEHVPESQKIQDAKATLEAIVPRKEMQVFDELLEYDEDESEALLTRLVELHHSLSHKMHLVTFCDWSWLARLRGIWSSLENMSVVFRRVVAVGGQVGSLLNSVETEIENTYLTLFDVDSARFSSFDKGSLDLCQEVLLKSRLRRLQSLDFSPLERSIYQSRIELVETLTDKSEQLVQLDLISRELDGLPKRETLLLWLKTWSSDLNGELAVQLKEAVTERCELLQPLKPHIQLLMRHILDKGGRGETHHHLKAFGLELICACNLADQWRSVRPDPASIVSLKTAQKCAQRLEHLSQALLCAQSVFQPERDGKKNIERLLSPISVSAQLADDLVWDLGENYKALLQLKNKVDDDYYQIRIFLQALGKKGDVSHLILKLNVDDVEKICANYLLKKGLDQESLLRFGTLYTQRATSHELIIDCIRHDVPTEFVNSWDELRTVYNEGRRNPHDVKLRLAMLYFVPTFRKLEGDFLCLFLNLASPLQLLKARVFQNYIALLKYAELTGNGQRYLRSFWGATRKQLSEYQPLTHVHNFQFNCDIFLRETQKIEFMVPKPSI